MFLKKKTPLNLEKDKGIKEFYIKKLQKRYATKGFSKKSIPDDDIHKIKELLRLSPSSYGLQPYQFVIVNNQKVKDSLYEVSYNQPQIKECSHLVVLCAKQTISDQDITDYINLMAETRKVDPASLSGFQGMIKNNVLSMNEKEQCQWASRQIYLALGNLLSACALFDIDACPMETFHAEKYNMILQLEQKGLTASVLAALGYRAKLDSYQYKKKVRKPVDQLFIDF